MDVKEGKAYPMMPTLHYRKKAHGWLESSDKRNQKRAPRASTKEREREREREREIHSDKNEGGKRDCMF